MLHVWMYQRYRCLIHSGMCCSTHIAATKIGGSSTVAATMNISPAWKTRLPGWWTANSWVVAAQTVRIAETRQSAPSTPPPARSANADAAATTTAHQHARALGRRSRGGAEMRVENDSSRSPTPVPAVAEPRLWLYGASRGGMRGVIGRQDAIRFRPSRLA